MAHRLRYIPPNSLVEVTVRTLQGRFLLAPRPSWNPVFIGLLARAKLLFPVRIHIFKCLSNHLHILLSVRDAQQLSSFMGHFLTNLSKEVGRLHGWPGPKFQRRYQPVVVTDEEGAQVERLRYILSQGVKEGLVEKPGDWPGPHCADALVGGRRLRGHWISRTDQWAARNRGSRLSDREASTEYELELEPLPCWAHHSADRQRYLVRQILADIEEQARAQRRVGDLPAPMGVRALLEQDPHHRPAKLKRSPAPLIHAVSTSLRREFRSAYNAFASAYYEAKKRLREGYVDPGFPEGAFPPPVPIRASG